MPTYEYRCEKGHEFEVFQRMSEPAVEKCIQCGAQAERLLSAGAGLIFKGSGFYITDYARSESYKKDAASDKAPSSTDKASSGPDKASTSSTSSKASTSAPSATQATPSKSSDAGSSKSSGTSGSD